MTLRIVCVFTQLHQLKHPNPGKEEILRNIFINIECMCFVTNNQTFEMLQLVPFDDIFFSRTIDF